MEKLESIMDNFENKTIKRQNSVDRTLADHTMKLLELTHNLNKTKGTSQFNLDSDTQCNYYKPRQRTSAAISETRTPWYPTEDDSDVVSTEIFSMTFWTNGMFTLPNTDSYTDSDNMQEGYTETNITGDTDGKLQ